MASADQFSNAAVRAVARRLKHYIDVERREEGFDTSGPLKPLGDYRVGKGLGGTFHYNSLQDKHMLHYYQQPLMRKHLIEMGIAHPGMFCRKSKSRRHSKSAGQRPRAKSESAHLMETSAKVLIEQGPQLHMLAQRRTSKSNRFVSCSVSTRTSSSTHSTSNASNSDCSLPRRRQRNSVGLSQSDVVLTINNEKQNVSSRGSIASQQNGEDKGVGQSHEHSVQTGKWLSSPNPPSQQDHCDGAVPQHDAPDALINSQTLEGGSPHQQMIASLHQGLTHPHFTSSPPILATPAGGGVTNVRSRNTVMQESASVSTVTCRDASTQTLTHAETQTDQSTLFKMAMRRQKRIERESKTNLKDETSATRNGLRTVNGSAETTVALSQNETEEVLDGSGANAKTTATFSRESKVHTYIHKLAASGDVIKIKEVLAENPTLVGSLSEQGHTPLHVASIAGKSQVVEVLRLFGAELMTETPTGYTAMHCAAMYGNLDCLKALVSMKCDVNCQTIDKQTPLHLAAMSGQLECCQWLVANKANLTAKDNNVRTPYDIAKENDHQEIAHYLTSNADPVKVTLSGTSLDGEAIKQPDDTRGTNSSAGLLSANPVIEFNINTADANVDDELRSTLQTDPEAAKEDSGQSVSATVAGGEDNQTVDDPHHSHPAHDSSETHRDMELTSQVNIQTVSISEKSDSNLSAASLQSNPEAFLEVKTDSDVVKLTENQDDPVLNERSWEHEMERSPSPEAVHEANTEADSNVIKSQKDKDPGLNEALDKSSELETKRTPSPASQQHRPASPNDDLRETESILSNISDLQLSSDSTTSVSTLN